MPFSNSTTVRFLAPLAAIVTRVPKFISSEAVAVDDDHLGRGWARANPRARLVACPMADGKNCTSKRCCETLGHSRALPMVVTTSRSSRNRAMTSRAEPGACGRPTWQTFPMTNGFGEPRY